MKIQSIHQIEMTSNCNLRCQYCVHPKMPRVKWNMLQDIWDRSLALVRYFVRTGTQGAELNLAGIGESTLHPNFCDWVLQARRAVGHDRLLILATNGVGVTHDHASAMRAARMKVWVSLHRPEKAGPTIELLKPYGVLAGVSADPSIAAVNWAGQVNYHVSTDVKAPCPWLSQGRAFVMSDGRVGTCCFDGQGKDGVVGTVWDDVWELDVKPYSLCQSCHHSIPTT